MPVPEYTAQPNDPELFTNLVGVMNQTTANRAPFHLIFSPDYNPENDADYFLNNYPNQPEELFGVAGVMSDAYSIQQELAHKPELDIVKAGNLACGNALVIGAEQMVNIWTFDDAHQERYGRIGEISLSPVARDPQDGKTDIYVVNRNGSVWTKGFCNIRGPWRQLIDHELEELTELARSLI